MNIYPIFNPLPLEEVPPVVAVKKRKEKKRKENKRTGTRCYLECISFYLLKRDNGLA
jgi:hypothetical protein